MSITPTPIPNLNPNRYIIKNTLLYFFNHILKL